MARFTFNIELDSSSDRTGLTAVMIRLHQKGQLPARVQTHVKLADAAKYWSLLDKKRKAKEEDKQRVKVDWGKWVIKHPDAAALNAAIEKEYNRIKEQTRKWQDEQLLENPDLDESTLTPKQVGERFRKVRPAESYFDLAAPVLEEMKVLSVSTWLLRRTALNMLKRFAGDDIGLSNVTVPLIESFQAWLRNGYVTRKKQHLKPSSINLYMEAMTILHEAILQAGGYSRRKAKAVSPFTEISPLKAKTAYRAKFDEEAIDKLKIQPVVTRLRRVKPGDAFTVWVLSHLLAGMRFGDLMGLRYYHFTVNEEGNPVHLAYTMNKTGNSVSIPLFDEVQGLLKHWWNPQAKPTDYLLPYLRTDEPYADIHSHAEYKSAPFATRKILADRIAYWNRSINTALAEIEKAAGLKNKLRMHNARHSFADLARRIMQEDGTIDLLGITRLLGQSDPRMVMRYIEEMEKQDSSKPMAAVFNRKRKETV